MTLPTISKRFLSILYFRALDKLIDGIADHFQQLDFLVYNEDMIYPHESTKTTLIYLLSYVIGIAITSRSDIDQTDFKMGHLKVKLGQFSTVDPKIFLLERYSKS